MQNEPIGKLFYYNAVAQPGAEESGRPARKKKKREKKKRKKKEKKRKKKRKRKKDIERMRVRIWRELHTVPKSVFFAI